MFNLRIKILFQVSIALATFGIANATMPMLTETPKRPTPALCDKWAAEQSDDAVEMWGVQSNGSSSNSIALLRLKRHCMGEAKPGIVGFGSSVGFDDAYCKKHPRERVCLNRLRQAAPGTEEQLEKAKEAAKNSDFATAFRIWEPLARQGNPQAQYDLGIMYYYGEGVRRDFAKALVWRQKAALQGHAAAKLDIGVQYSNGDGVRVNHVEATKWFRQAAEAGNALAQFNLGLNFENGQGVAQDIGEALKWHTKAAEQNSGKAQWHVAKIYGNDASSFYDPQKAISWYGMAALNGIVPAQLALGILFSRGRGVPVDMVRARVWLKFAAGDTGSGLSFDNGAAGDEAKKLLSDVERFMDQRQLDASKSMIAQCNDEKHIEKALIACGLR